MANPFIKGWKYTMAAFGAKIDEKADPKIQIQQAIEDAQRQHQALTQQAAAVIGNQRQLEMKLARQMSEVEKLQGSARQALVLSEQARAAGDPTKAAAERTQLMSQLEQAKMQEAVTKSLTSMSELSAPGNTPSLDDVRDKIETRYAKALGGAELASSSVEGRMLEVEKSTMDFAAQTRLDQIRASLSGPATGPAITTGTPSSSPTQSESGSASGSASPSPSPSLDKPAEGA